MYYSLCCAHAWKIAAQTGAVPTGLPYRIAASGRLRCLPLTVSQLPFLLMAMASDVLSSSPCQAWSEAAFMQPVRRRRKTSAERRAQRNRAAARHIGWLLKGVAELEAHRGSAPSAMVGQLAGALTRKAKVKSVSTADVATAAARAAPAFPPGVWEPIPDPIVVSTTPSASTDIIELPLICLELQKILGPEIHAAQASGVKSLGAEYKARLCHIIDIIDLAFAHNV